MPKTCENCGRPEPTSFATYIVQGREIEVALCDECGDEETRSRIIKLKAARLPPIKIPKPKPKLFVVVEVQSRDDYYANQPLKTPVAAFIDERKAVAYVESKRSEEFLYLDWEIVSTPLEDMGKAEN